MKKILLCLSLIGIAVIASADYQPEFSAGGFYMVEDGPREVFDLNPGWRFLKGDAEGAETLEFDDAGWRIVNLPDGMEVLPINASGSINYQGEAWYRKHFELPPALNGKRHFIHFEGIMGKSKVWINGQQVAEHFGGYLPLHIDATDYLKPGEKNLVAVWVDNSDDPTYAPGKPQTGLDFTYFGGIYRDVRLISTMPVHISNANGVDEVAGGGLFFHTDSANKYEAKASLKVHVLNSGEEESNLLVESTLLDEDGNPVAKDRASVMAPARQGAYANFSFAVKNPRLWHPDHPNLYDLMIRVKSAKGELLDAVRLRVGLRTVELRGPEGLFINGEFFEEKLIGGNRHQDFAHIGNAVPNNLHWRDAKKLRDAGMRIIRVAHYPQDPSFMDACDELGLFVIVAAPGWHHFQKGIFEERVFNDIRQMIRRDRNHASVFAWEPILNEINYPKNFAFEAARISKTEYPFSDCYLGCDSYADGPTEYKLMYGNSDTTLEQRLKHRWWGPYGEDYLPKVIEHYKTAGFFIREFGDFVNDWIAQDALSRVPKERGEAAQLSQVDWYAECLRSMMSQPTQMFGGCLWHPFEHQRGYHPDHFQGGIMDAARQPKYSYWAFMAQRNPDLKIEHVESGPFVRVLHELTGSSANDVVVASNCEEVRLTANGISFGTQSTQQEGVPFYRRLVVFKNAFSFSTQKRLLREKKRELTPIIAEGLIGGEVVCTHTNEYAGLRKKIQLTADDSGAKTIADGSDILTVVAHVTDEWGNVKRHGQNTLQFEVTGAGSLVGNGADSALNINPQFTKWGEAVILVRAGTEPGAITIKVREYGDGPMRLEPAELTVETVAPALPQIYSELPPLGQKASSVGAVSADVKTLQKKLHKTEQELIRLRQMETAWKQDKRTPMQD